MFKTSVLYLIMTTIILYEIAMVLNYVKILIVESSFSFY